MYSARCEESYRRFPDEYTTNATETVFWMSAIVRTFFILRIYPLRSTSKIHQNMQGMVVELMDNFFWFEWCITSLSQKWISCLSDGRAILLTTICNFILPCYCLLGSPWAERAFGIRHSAPARGYYGTRLHCSAVAKLCCDLRLSFDIFAFLGVEPAWKSLCTLQRQKPSACTFDVFCEI